MKDEKEKVTLTSNDVAVVDAAALKPKAPTIKTLCVVCNDMTAHTMTVDLNKETVVECEKCGHPIKFPEGFNVAAGLKKHEDVNGRPKA